jgi:hypothetical protein
MIGYWFKPSILLYFLFTFTIFSQTNTNKYILNIASENVRVTSTYINKEHIQIDKFPFDISNLVNNKTNLPQFSFSFAYNQINFGRYKIRVEIYKNDILIQNNFYQGIISSEIYSENNTNDPITARSFNLFVIDK